MTTKGSAPNWCRVYRWAVETVWVHASRCDHTRERHQQRDAGGDLRLLDEALHLAAALQLVGYRHVLATLWSISDAAAPAMADITYAHLLHPDPDHPNPDDQPEAARAPYALHHAVTRLRQTYPGEPLLWAPYMHLGP